MLMPDNAENRGFENINFWLEHVVLFTLPIVWMARRRFHIYGGAANVVVSWAIFFIVHGAVLTPWSILSGRNIDYMMVRREAGQHACSIIKRLSTALLSLLRDLPIHVVVPSPASALDTERILFDVM